MIPTMSLKERTVVHYELFPYCQFPRHLRTISFESMCNCKIPIRCLCYLEKIKEEMVEQFWGDPEDYQVFSDWISLS